MHAIIATNAAVYLHGGGMWMDPVLFLFFFGTGMEMEMYGNGQIEEQNRKSLFLSTHFRNSR